MRTAILGFIAALMLATPAFAIDAPEQQYQQAFENLLDAISENISQNFDGDLDKEEKKILRALKKGERVGSKIVSIDVDKRGLKTAGKVLKSVEKAQKYDAELLATHVAAMKSAIQAVVDEINADAEGARDKLDVERNLNRITKVIDKSSTKIANIDTLWSEKFSKAWNFYLKAWLGFAKAIVKADKLYEKEMKSAKPPSGLKFDVDGKLINSTGEKVMLTDLVYNLSFKVPNVPAQTVKLKLSEISPQSLPIDLGTDAFDPALYSQVWQGLSAVPGIKVTGTILYQTTAGNLTFRFK